MPGDALQGLQSKSQMPPRAMYCYLRPVAPVTGCSNREVRELSRWKHLKVEKRLRGFAVSVPMGTQTHLAAGPAHKPRRGTTLSLLRHTQLQRGLGTLSTQADEAQMLYVQCKVRCHGHGAQIEEGEGNRARSSLSKASLSPSVVTYLPTCASPILQVQADGNTHRFRKRVSHNSFGIETAYN